MRTLSVVVGVGLLAGCSSTPEPPPFNPKSTVDANLTKSVLAPSSFALVEGLGVGGRAERETTIPGVDPIRTWFAVVDETETHWRVECVSESLQSLHATNAETRELIIGCEVDKQSGAVTAAIVGKAGELGIAIGLEESLDEDLPPADEAVTLTLPGLGEVPAIKNAFPEYEETSWFGAEGELKGVLLKLEGPDTFQLKAAPTTGSVDVAGQALDVLVLSYDNDAVVQVSSDPFLATFFPTQGANPRGVVVETQPYFSSTLVAYASDATPALVWDAPEGATEEPAEDAKPADEAKPAEDAKPAEGND